MVRALEIAGPTSLGTSTTKTKLGGASITLPAWAQALLGIRAGAVSDTPTAAESVLGLIELESDSNYVAPFQVFTPPIASILGATTQQVVKAPEKYPVMCPLKGGSTIDVYGTALVANTAAPYAAVELLLSDRPEGGIQKHAKAAAIKNQTIAATTEYAGNSIQFTGGRVIKELLGVLGPTTVAASDAGIGQVRFSSSEFEISGPMKLLLNPICGGLSTLIAPVVDGVSRVPVEMPLKGVGQTTITPYISHAIYPAAAVNWSAGVIYE